MDLRSRSNGLGLLEPTDLKVMNAQGQPGLGLHASGFELVRSPSAVSDFHDCQQVMATYYEECKALAQKLTGADATFTYDHIIREPGVQHSGGGTDGYAKNNRRGTWRRLHRQRPHGLHRQHDLG